MLAADRAADEGDAVAVAGAGLDVLQLCAGADPAQGQRGRGVARLGARAGELDPQVAQPPAGVFGRGHAGAGRPSSRDCESRAARNRSAPPAPRATYDRLLRAVWGGRGTQTRGQVRTYVKKLRHKLGDDAASPAYILTARGVGYRMPEPGSGAGP